ncbi:MAG: NADH-quinone oxidoreductase subunit C [Campylobacterales bacterium]|nr:NADH-quinone oxidoreductase subunit C [Campylobacterales bacterium]
MSEVPYSDLFAHAQSLKSEGYTLLLDIVGIDYLYLPRKEAKRFGVIYHLRHGDFDRVVSLHVSVNEDEPISSLSPLFR